MSFKLIPNDIPLPVPTGGLEIVDAVLTLLLVVAWLVHILFINVLLGASTGSVYFNKRGARENNPVFDRVGYLLTTPVTISENMGALWGVAPLLLISVMFTPLLARILRPSSTSVPSSRTTNGTLKPTCL